MNNIKVDTFVYKLSPYFKMVHIKCYTCIESQKNKQNLFKSIIFDTMICTLLEFLLII